MADDRDASAASTSDKGSGGDAEWKQCIIALQKSVSKLTNEVAVLRENNENDRFSYSGELSFADRHLGQREDRFMNSDNDSLIEQEADAGDSEAAFCVDQKEELVQQDGQFGAWEDELNLPEQAGPEVHERLAKVANARFKSRLTENERKDKFAANLLPSNCQNLRPPTLNAEVLDRANLSQNARRDDSRLVNVQTLIAKATAAAVNSAQSLQAASQKLLSVDSKSFADVKRQNIEAANETLRGLKDITAFLGTAQQELSARRRFQLMRALPKEWASICTNEAIPVDEHLFGGDVLKHIGNAKECYKARATPSYRGNRNQYHPYRGRGRGSTGAFLGQGSPGYQKTGPGFQSSPRGKGNGYQYQKGSQRGRRY